MSALIGVSIVVWVWTALRAAGDAAPNPNDASSVSLIVEGDPSPRVDSGRPPLGMDAPTRWAEARFREVPRDPPRPRVSRPIERVGARSSRQRATVVRESFASVQVNVDENGENIEGDVANEPSIAVDPTRPGTIVIGWRQFDSASSDFRQAGYAYSHDGGQGWTFPGVLEQDVFRSDPVLEADLDGNIYYHSLTVVNGDFTCDIFKSVDGGVNWLPKVFAYGGDKAWFTIDKTNNASRGFLYAAWSANAGCCGTKIFNRSVDGGAGFSFPVSVPLSPRWGTVAVGPDSEVYVAGTIGNEFVVAKSANAKDPNATPQFDQIGFSDLGGALASFRPVSPNPDGLLGQVWVAVDHSTGLRRGHVYLLASVDPPGPDPLDVMFTRSRDGGLNWDAPVRVNDDAPGIDAWQWFGTMSVAPSGRIDVVWNDTRDDASAQTSELYYSQSSDGGQSWTPNVAVSPAFNSHIGYPGGQQKIGDYYDTDSDDLGASVAYAATFNGEQDVYFLRIGGADCNHNDIPDDQDITNGTSGDCDGNLLPDECGRDCNANAIPDACEVLNGAVDDCNENVVPDLCERDYDLDGEIDGCDSDVDGDGVVNGTDVCPFTPLGFPVKPNGGPLGDLNANCRLDLADHPRFVGCILAGGPDSSPSRLCELVFDINGNGSVDLADFARFQAGFVGGEP